MSPNKSVSLPPALWVPHARIQHKQTGKHPQACSCLLPPAPPAPAVPSTTLRDLYQKGSAGVPAGGLGQAALGLAAGHRALEHARCHAPVPGSSAGTEVLPHTPALRSWLLPIPLLFQTLVLLQASSTCEPRVFKRNEAPSPPLLPQTRLGHRSLAAAPSRPRT